MALQIASLTRFATSNGTDADSWAGDYGFTRLPAQFATGAVTFARFTPTAQATILIGTVVQTADGTQKYTVIVDPLQTAYNATLGAYVIAAGATSCTATVQSVVAAAAANAAAAAVNTLGAAVAGVDTVTNVLGLTAGADAEGDAAFRARFLLYIASLSKATRVAIGQAITSVQQGVTYSLVEDLTYGGVAQPGFFYAVVDDGTGTPAGSFLTAVSNAVDAVRPIASTFAIFAPSVISANVSMSLTTNTGYTHSAVVTIVQAALQAYINLLTIGAPLQYSKLASIAYGASAGVTNVTGVLLNSGTADLTATNQQVIKAGVFTIT